MSINGMDYNTCMNLSDTDCLVVVDMQYGFMNSNTITVRDDIVKLLDESRFSHVIATRFENHPGSPWVKLMHWDRLVAASEQEILPEIQKKSTKIITKSKYSCVNNDFLNYVSNNRIERLFFCGVDTEGCVLMSAVDAFEHDLSCYVLSGYCASSFGDTAHQSGLRVIRNLIGANRVI